MDLTIIWILFFAWAASCIFYFSKISRIAHSNRLSVFSSLNKYNKTLRTIIKRLYYRILFITLAFFLAVALIYLLKDNIPE
jgi:uncharacterized protein YggT (Ycf19 family)